MNFKVTLDADSAFQQGLALQKSGRLLEARNLYQQALQLQPKHAGALHQLGVVALQSNRPDVAADLISRAIRCQLRSPAAQLNYGRALAQLQRHEQAIASYAKAIEFKPDYADAYN